MKKVLIAAAALSLTFGSSCTKQTSTLPPVKDTVYIDSNAGKVPIDTSTTISGIKDIRISPWGTTSTAITVNRNSGLEQKVSMMISGVPENVTAKFSSESGYTSFSTTLMVEAMFLKRGTYPLTIASKTEKGKTTDYTVNLTVDTLTTKESNTMLYSKLSNIASSKDTTTDSVLYATTYIYNNVSENQLYLRNLLLVYNDLTTKRYVSYNTTSTYHIKFNFDSETGMLTIPDQLIDGRAVTGGAMATFTVKGEGKVDLKTNMAEIIYTTSYDDGTGIVSQAYKLVAPLY